MVLFERRERDVDFDALSFFLSNLFLKRRKTIKNNLKNLFEDPEGILRKLNIDPMKRPENLLLEEIFRIFEEWYSWRKNFSKKC